MAKPRIFSNPLPISIVPRRVTVPELAALVARIEKTYDPDDILLFGSRASGTARADSDWDVMVIVPDDADETLLDPVLGWETQQGSGVRADVLCAYRGEFLADLAVVNSRARAVAQGAVGLVTS